MSMPPTAAGQALASQKAAMPSSARALRRP